MGFLVILRHAVISMLFQSYGGYYLQEEKFGKGAVMVGLEHLAECGKEQERKAKK